MSAVAVPVCDCHGVPMLPNGAGNRWWVCRVLRGESVRASRLKRVYGITVEQYDALRETQDFRCALCGLHESEMNRRMAVDHDHETGEVRGLLCVVCNRLLGWVEGPVPVSKISDYLGGGSDK